MTSEGSALRILGSLGSENGTGVVRVEDLRVAVSG